MLKIRDAMRDGLMASGKLASSVEFAWSPGNLRQKATIFYVASSAKKYQDNHQVTLRLRYIYAK